MTYTVKEIFYSLQGEGAHSGRPAVFCRFAGCNLWSGREQDRETAVCKFCDTDFVGCDGKGGGKFKTANELAKNLKSYWPESDIKPYLVCTGGEPMLQLDDELIQALHKQGFEIAIETNGTIKVPETIDWICVSPKADAELIQITGNELKLVYPQNENTPKDFEHLNFDRFYLQAKEDDKINEHLKQTLDYCLKNPKWNLSLQTHKLLNIR